MNSGLPEEPTSWGRRWAGYALFAGAAFAVVLLLAWKLVPDILQGELFGPDSYMRLVRVRRLLETGAWFDHTIPRSNAPFGEVLHWTRPLDVLLIALRSVLRIGLAPDAALHWAGVLLPPLLLIATCFAAGWAVLPLVGIRFRTYAMITVLAQPVIVGYALPGRPDHHPLLILIYTVAVGFAVRWILQPASRGSALGTGFTLGLGLWVGPEFLVPIALALLAGVLFWIARGQEEAQKNSWLALGLTAAVAIAVALEHPPSRLLEAEFDRVSAPHLLMALLALSFWLLAGRLGRKRPDDGIRDDRPGWQAPNPDPRRRAILSDGTVDDRPGWRTRLAATALLGALALGALYAAYPEFYRGPEAAVDPRLAPLWLTLVAEYQPLVHAWDSVGLGVLISHLGGAFLGLLFTAWAALCKRNTGARRAWLFLGLSLVSLSGLALFRVRFTGYPEILAVLTTAGLLSLALPGLASLKGPIVRVALSAGVAGGLIAGPILAGFALLAFGDRPPAAIGSGASPQAQPCLSSLLVRYLATDRRFLGRDLTLLADMDYGPEILYRTPYQVVATPYHRNVRGILDLFAVYGSHDPAESRRILRERGVDLLLVCPAHAWLYKAKEGGTEPGTSLIDRLVATGRQPPWLERIEIPPEAAGEFRVYEMVEPDRAGSAALSAAAVQGRSE